MKFNYKGNIVEIKVTPENGKKVDTVQTKSMFYRIGLAMLHAENFCTGNGWYKEAKDYSELAHAMIDNQI